MGHSCLMGFVCMFFCLKLRKCNEPLMTFSQYFLANYHSAKTFFTPSNEKHTSSLKVMLFNF